MPVRITRIRTLGVRLSEDEYSSLEKFCLESGARSISDIARTAICNFVNRAKEERALTRLMRTHSAQVGDVKRTLDQLRSEISQLNSKRPTSSARGKRLRKATATDSGQSR